VKSLLSALILALISEANSNVGKYKISCSEQCQKNEYKSGCDEAATIGKQKVLFHPAVMCSIHVISRNLQGNVTSAVHPALLANMRSGAVEPHLANARTAHYAPLGFTRRDVAGLNQASVLSAQNARTTISLSFAKACCPMTHVTLRRVLRDPSRP
jgi:hypothetical protein